MNATHATHCRPRLHPQVIRISGGAQCRGATLRDVASYALCVTVVALALHSGSVSACCLSLLWLASGFTLSALSQGPSRSTRLSQSGCFSPSWQVTRWFVAGTALAYALYAGWVFLGDEWHARGRPALQPRLHWSDLRALLLQR